MADVMSHGGDGAGDPPQQPSHRLPSACESAPPPKRRGISRGINLEMVWQANEKMPLPIAFDNVERTMQPIGNNAKYFTRLVGNQVRFTVPPCYPSWTEVPEEQRARLRSIIESYFDLQGDRSPDEYWAVCAAVDRLAADRYRNYKLKAHNHLKAHGLSRPYGEMSAKDWQKCIDFFTSPTFVDRSSKNKANRGKAKYPSVQGSKSFSATRYDQRDPKTQKWLGIIDSFQTFHTFRDGNWVNPQAAGDYDKLVEFRETQQTQVASNSASLDERAIAKEVLGERRGHVRGVGRVPKGTSHSLDSTAALFAPQGTSHQSSADPQNNDIRFAMYEEQLRQMQREIELLKSKIPTAPADEEDGLEATESETTMAIIKSMNQGLVRLDQLQPMARQVEVLVDYVKNLLHS